MTLRRNSFDKLRFLAGLFGAMALLAGCNKAPPPPKSAQDVEHARQEASREVAQARAEASKDVKSAVKVAGANSPEVVHARVTAAYDIAMAKADGEHQIATEKCLTLANSMLQSCREHADSDYEAAKAAAKLTRAARE